MADKNDISALVASAQLTCLAAYMLVCYHRLDPREVMMVEKVPLDEMPQKIQWEIGETIRGHIDDLLSRVPKDENSLWLISDALSIAYPIISQGLGWSSGTQLKVCAKYLPWDGRACRVQLGLKSGMFLELKTGKIAFQWSIEEDPFNCGLIECETDYETRAIAYRWEGFRIER